MAARETLNARWEATRLVRALEAGNVRLAIHIARDQVDRWECVDHSIAGAMTDLRSGVCTEEMERRSRVRVAERQRRHRAALA